MAQTLARCRTTRHLTLSHLLPNRLLSTTSPSSSLTHPPPLLTHQSLTPLSQTARSMSFLVGPRPTEPSIPSLSQTVRSIQSSPTVRSISLSPSFRPLSPHLPVYKPQVSSTFSILNRISASLLSVVVLGFYLIYMKSGSICMSFNNFYQFLFYSSKLNILALEISALALIYHVYYGIGHLVADLSGIKKQRVAAALFLFATIYFIFAYLPLLNSGSNFTQMEGLPSDLFVGPEHKDDGAELSVNGGRVQTPPGGVAAAPESKTPAKLQ